MQLAFKSFVLFSMSQWTVVLFTTCPFVESATKKREKKKKFKLQSNSLAILIQSKMCISFAVKVLIYNWENILYGTIAPVDRGLAP